MTFDQDDAVHGSGIALLDSSRILINQVTGLPGLNLENILKGIFIESTFNTIMPQHSQNEDTPAFVISSTIKQTDNIPEQFTDRNCTLDADRNANVDALNYGDSLLNILIVYAIWLRSFRLFSKLPP